MSSCFFVCIVLLAPFQVKRSTTLYIVSCTVQLSPSLVHIANRENSIVNRLNKTKIERQVDHEQERIDRIKKENQAKRAEAAQKVSLIRRSRSCLMHSQKKEEAELAKKRAEEKAAWSYDSLFNVEEEPEAPKPTGKAIEEDFM